MRTNSRHLNSLMNLTRTNLACQFLMKNYFEFANLTSAARKNLPHKNLARIYFRLIAKCIIKILAVAFMVIILALIIFTAKFCAFIRLAFIVFALFVFIRLALIGL